MTQGEPSEEREKVLVLLVDIIYGVIMGFCIERLVTAALIASYVSLALLTLILFLMADNWYGIRYVEVTLRMYPSRFLVFHVLEAVMFATLISLAEMRSVFLILGFSVYALFGAVWDILIYYEIKHERLVLSYYDMTIEESRKIVILLSLIHI